MIGLQSYSQAFNTIIGWQQYNALWQIITTTGLIYVPFIIVVAKSCSQVLLQPQSNSNPYKPLFTIIGIIAAITIAVQPIMPLTTKFMNFNNACGNKAIIKEGISKPNSPQLQNIKVPVLWYAIMSIAYGITEAATSSIPCEANIRTINTELRLSTIKGPAIKQQTQWFYQQCFMPSWHKYLNTTGNKNNDTNWLGGEYYLQVPGYYDLFMAQQPLSGFEVNTYPSCKQWWNAPAVGLKQQLLNNLSPTIKDYITLNPQAKIYALKSLVNHGINIGNDNAIATPATSHSIAEYIGSKIGLSLSKLSFYPKMYLVINALPIVQSYILLGLYVFLSIVMLISSYNPKILLQYSIIIFSVIFWSYLWQLTAFIDSALIKTLYPLQGLDVSNNITATLIDMIAIVMYIGLPLLFTIIIAAAGNRFSYGIGSIVAHGVEPMSAAGAQAGGVVQGGMPRVVPGVLMKS